MGGVLLQPKSPHLPGSSLNASVVQGVERALKEARALCTLLPLPPCPGPLEASRRAGEPLMIAWPLTARPSLLRHPQAGQLEENKWRGSLALQLCAQLPILTVGGAVSGAAHQGSLSCYLTFQSLPSLLCFIPSKQSGIPRICPLLSPRNANISPKSPVTGEFSICRTFVSSSPTVSCDPKIRGHRFGGLTVRIVGNTFVVS